MSGFHFQIPNPQQPCDGAIYLTDVPSSVTPSVWGLADVTGINQMEKVEKDICRC